jgi:CO/xanthine dehydrogenase Mo-binding subunit
MLIAEELDADWTRIRVVQADMELRVAEFIGTGGSSSVSSLFEPLRKAGAAAREMLIAAAAARWNVPARECRTEAGAVIHDASNRRAGYGSLVEAARTLPVPANPTLKPRSAFRVIGSRTPRLDNGMKVDGSAIYGGDLRLPGMLFAVIARCPIYGGSIKSFDDTKTKAIAGVRHVVPLYDPADGNSPVAPGLAIVADTTWAALEGRRVLEVTWNEGPNRTMSSASLERRFDDAAKRAGVPHRNDGNVSSALAASARTITSTYRAPFLAHQAIEPLVAVADVRADRCEVWGPFQYPDGVEGAAKRITGLPVEKLRIHTTLIGGGFGRKAYSDFATEALEVSKRVGVPVQLQWTREDDVQFDYFRPPSRHVMSAGFDRAGKLTAWRHKMATPSLRAQWDWGKKDEDVVRGLDKWATESSGQIPYRAPNMRVEFVMTPVPIPVGAWRGVYCAQAAFADECFVDELAIASSQDPLAFRLALIGEASVAEGGAGGDAGAGSSAPHRAVLERAAREAGWGTPLPAGRARGIAVYKANDSFVAQVAEVSVDAAHAVRVHRVVCAIDCGLAVNPDIVEAQMEGSIIFALSAALTGEITFENGRCKQSNFHDAPLLRLPDAPRIDVHIMQSVRNPSGVGEPGVSPLAPAVANAVSAALGVRIRELPLTPARLAAAIAAHG